MTATAIVRRDTTTHLWIFLAALLPRIVAAYLRAPSDPDWGHYWRLSSGLLHYGVLGYDEASPTTSYEPLYPLLLAGCRWLAADDPFLVFAAQASVASLGAPFLYELTLLATHKRRSAVIAALIYCFYPYYVSQSTTATEVSLLTTLLVAAASLYRAGEQPRSAILCGFVFGLVLLTRVAAAPIFALAILAWLARRRWALAAIVTVVSLLTYLPFAIRNHAIDGSLLPTRGGYDLFKGNCKYSDHVIPEYNVDVLDSYLGSLLVSEMPDYAAASEKLRDELYFAHALRFMSEHPARTVSLSLRKLALFFWPRLVPYHPVGKRTWVRFSGDESIEVENAVTRSLWEEFLYGASYSPLLLLAAIGTYRRRRLALHDDVFLHAVVISFLVVYSIYWTATRVRAPVDFVWMFFAACAFTGRATDE